MKELKGKLSLVFFCLSLSLCIAQTAKLTGRVLHHADNTPVPYASLISSNTNNGTLTDSSGNFTFVIAPGRHSISVHALRYKPAFLNVDLHAGEVKSHDFYLYSDTLMLEEVKITAARKSDWSIQRLSDTEGTAIYAGKKNEVIQLDKINANTSTNNMRQLYAKVPGINVIENDAAGIQLSIAARGLNPNRTIEFNTRQNGYDISADPLGYPESYYSPPADALEKIEIVRGAASLQYGSQFGGLVNFKFRQGTKDKTAELLSKQTAGSYGFFNSFNSLGGTVKKLNYYSFYNYKRSDGWRENTGFNIHTAHAAIKYRLNSRMTLGAELTAMQYVMKQPGGLTDAAFSSNPKASYRNGNWFSANWNMPSVTLDYSFSKNTKLNVRVYGLLGGRDNVGIIDKITIDTARQRTVMKDRYANVYTEVRLLHHYSLLHGQSSFLAGCRFYKGNTYRRQGNGDSAENANFDFSTPSLKLDFRFPSTNLAFFAENIFRLTSRLSVTPGIRYELIETNMVGSYDNTAVARKTRRRSFPLLGLGLGFKASQGTDLYANFSQNYSPINFSDVTIAQPGYEVDPNLKDVSGYNADLGYRGIVNKWLNFDLSVYYMAYNNRIDNTQKTGPQGTVTYRTNVADSRSMGAETFSEINVWKLVTEKDSLTDLNIFSSVSYTDARYVSNLLLFDNKKVSFAPSWILRYGISFRRNKFSTTLQYSRVSDQFSDATNAIASEDGATGIIPAYYVVDLSAGYSYKRWSLGLSLNNATNNHYFTRRSTTAFPGPGIIPSDARSLFLTVGIKI